VEGALEVGLVVGDVEGACDVGALVGV